MKLANAFVGLAGLALFGVGTAPAVEPGQAAPDFTLKDTDGKERSLSEFKGKFVVLEWVNHGCPFVKKHYESGNMPKLQKEYTARDVVWLSICSSAEGKQGYAAPEAAAADHKKSGGASTAYLLDTDGRVGKTYEATNTPQMFVINPEGTLLYVGAIDSIPSGRQEDITGATNYVKQALDEALAGKPVSHPVSRPYGCGVKY